MSDILLKAEENGKAIGLFLLVIALVLRFAYWQLSPSVISATIFWVFAIWGGVFWILGEIWDEKPGWVVGRSISLCGAICNAVVTIANNGFMPVESLEDSYSLWVTATNQHHLLFLSDRFAGFSIGDFIIIGGLLVALAYKGLTETDAGIAILDTLDNIRLNLASLLVYGSLTRRVAKDTNQGFPLELQSLMAGAIAIVIALSVINGLRTEGKKTQKRNAKSVAVK